MPSSQRSLWISKRFYKKFETNPLNFETLSHLSMYFLDLATFLAKFPTFAPGFETLLSEFETNPSNFETFPRLSTYPTNLSTFFAKFLTFASGFETLLSKFETLPPNFATYPTSQQIPQTFKRSPST